MFLELPNMGSSAQKYGYWYEEKERFLLRVIPRVGFRAHWWAGL